jgi:SAM-dependent methyltransferase
VGAASRETLARLHINPTDSILDVGCGTGALLYQLSASYPQARLAGIDPSPEMLAIARQRLPSAVELKQSWAEGIPYPDGAFDVVVSYNVLHYIPEPIVALREDAPCRTFRGRRRHHGIGPMTTSLAESTTGTFGSLAPRTFGRTGPGS